MSILFLSSSFLLVLDYTLRCAASFKSSVLQEYDGVIKHTLKVILNVDLTDDVWRQATLPVSSGGLGVRLATDLALPAFLSSVNGAADLTMKLLPSRLHDVSGDRDPVCVAACLEWQTGHFDHSRSSKIRRLDSLGPSGFQSEA